GMTPYEILLSESQERMLMVLREGREAEAGAVFAKWELDCVTVGRVTDTGRMVLRWHGDVAADLPIAPISGASPVYERPWTPTPPPAPLAPVGAKVPPLEALRRLMACPDLAGKRWLWEQYDHLVMGDTVRGPGGDAAVVRIHGTDRALAMTTDCTPRYCHADPRTGGAQAVAEAWRNLTAVGARPLAITDCLNFGSPENPAVMGQFVGCIEGMAEACRALAFPVVSGNVSFYNETDGRAVLPTPTVGGVGVIDDLGRTVGIGWPRAGLALALIGDEGEGWLGASLYLREIEGREDGAPPPVDFDRERRTGDLVRRWIGEGRVLACHDLSDGGLLVALAEMALASAGNGAELAPPEGADAAPAGWLFGEDQARYLVALDPAGLDAALADAAAAGVPARRVGSTTGGDALTLRGHGAISLTELRRDHEGWLPSSMAAAHGGAGTGGGSGRVEEVREPWP
ncbi:MAG TPA: AIR synthase-related protein, partial [Geminicoccaceae bacterium]|nr:AIR synthase-related protein [Geminicoccaceae bacterium]